jgi:hypothetical protein
MRDIVFLGSKDASTLFLVHIDTEGYDCRIVAGMSPDSPYQPKFLLFKHKQLGEFYAATAQLASMGYNVGQVDPELTVAFKTF